MKFIRQFIVLSVFVLSILSSSKLANAQNIINGSIERVTPGGIAISGKGYPKSNDVSVISGKNAKMQWDNLRVGDKVRLSLNEKKQIALVLIVENPVTQREEKLLTKSKPVAGEWDVSADVAIKGRVFESAGRLSVYRGNYNRVVFSNDENYDLLELFVGVRDGSTEGDSAIHDFGRWRRTLSLSQNEREDTGDSRQCVY